MIEAFNALLKIFEDTLPLESVTKNWPDPDVDLVYPFMCVLKIREVPTRNISGGEFLGREGGKNIFKTADVESVLKCHTFFKQETDNEAVAQAMKDLFNREQVSRGIRGSFDFTYGEVAGRSMIANAQLEDVTLNTGANSLRQGERRTIYTVGLEAPEVQSVDQGIIKSVTLDARVGERVQVKNG